jgi:hypothetical protein
VQAAPETDPGAAVAKAQPAGLESTLGGAGYEVDWVDPAFAPGDPAL